MRPPLTFFLAFGPGAARGEVNPSSCLARWKVRKGVEGNIKEGPFVSYKRSEDRHTVELLQDGGGI